MDTGCVREVYLPLQHADGPKQRLSRAEVLSRRQSGLAQPSSFPGAVLLSELAIHV